MTRLVIGLGNPLRGDDAAGLLVADRIRSTRVCRSTCAAYELLDLWDGEDDVVVVDAMCSGANPGTVRVFDATREALPEASFASTHSVGLSESVELARSLGRLPDQLTVYGIEVGSVEAGALPTRQVLEAVAAVAAEIDRA